MAKLGVLKELKDSGHIGNFEVSHALRFPMEPPETVSMERGAPAPLPLDASSPTPTELTD